MLCFVLTLAPQTLAKDCTVLLTSGFTSYVFEVGYQRPLASGMQAPLRCTLSASADEAS